MKEPLLVVVGPTASGKTHLAIELALRLGGEVVSADSVQVYRHFDIGAGKPSPEELAAVPHHLLSIVEPDETLEANQWVERARPLIAEIANRGRVPIVCGGTFLWVRALLFGLAEAPPGDAEVRRAHGEFVEREGRSALHARLREVDPEIAARLHENDFVRVSRALEVFELSGRKMSDIQAEHGFRESHYEPILLGIEHERDAYDSLVHKRVRGMLEAGLVAEVEALEARGFGNSRAMSSVGYRQVHEALNRGPIEDERELQELIVRTTRVFARRQRTWLRDEPVRWIPSAHLGSTLALDELAAELQASLRRP